MESQCREAFVTLATNDAYSKGACVLAQSLRNNNSSRDIIIMVTPEVSAYTRSILECVFDRLIDVNIMDSDDATHLALLQRPELGVTFTKIHCWSLVEYDKCVFMDADTMVLSNIDELFEREELSAAPDPGWPDMFNSGVFVYRPSMDTYMALINLAETEGSFDGGDQGLLNAFFDTWSTSDINKHLSFLYNMHAAASYTYLPAFARFGHNTKVVHFLGSAKPWHFPYNPNTDVLENVEAAGLNQADFIKQWWRLFWQVEEFQQGGEWEGSSRQAEQRSRQRMWQTAQVDFTGQDKYENLEKKMDRVMHVSRKSRVKSTLKPRTSEPSKPTVRPVSQKTPRRRTVGSPSKPR